MANAPRQTGFFDAFAHPAWVVMMVAQMVLGLALVVALIMKYYMLVFGTVGCTGDDSSIANLVRCTPVLVMVAHFLLAVAAFRFVTVMFSDQPLAFVSPMMIALAGLFLLFLTGVSPEGSTWALAAVILVFFGVLAATLYAHYFFQVRAPKD
jgi:hypothetical protein